MPLRCAFDACLTSVHRQKNSLYLSLVIQYRDILKANERLCMRLKLSVDLRIFWDLIFSPDRQHQHCPKSPESRHK